MDTDISSAVGWINLTTLLLRRFASFGLASLHASVTRRAKTYGLDPQWVSIQPHCARVSPRSGGKPERLIRPGSPSSQAVRAPSHVRSGARAPLAAPLNCCSSTLMSETVRSRLQGRQPLGNVLMSHNALGRFRKYPSRRMPPPVACQCPRRDHQRPISRMSLRTDPSARDCWMIGPGLEVSVTLIPPTGLPPTPVIHGPLGRIASSSLSSGGLRERI